ncbi:hypothetical protein IWQ56_002485, partial [Coemansia nantahalensis]
ARAPRPTSASFGSGPVPFAEMHQAQIEEELDTIMDSMGLLGDQRLAMKDLPAERKLQLIQTHKASRGSVRPDATPLSEHLKILGRAGTQSLPLARLEKLRVDVSYQTIDQIAAFLDGGGLRLLLGHLVQLNERRAPTRRADELKKELEILRCVLGIAKVPAGAKAMADGSTSICHVLDSLSTQWMPCSVVCLRIASVLIHHDDPPCAAAAMAALFRAEASVAKRRPAFADWMDTIDAAIAGFDAGDPQTRADIVDFMTSSLALVNSVVDALAASMAKRVKFYERLAAHDMLAKLAGLRAWHVSVLDSHLNRWDEVLRRDYNIARTQRPDAASDGHARSIAQLQSFVAHYEEAKAATAAAAAAAAARNSDDDDDAGYLQMNLSTYASPRSDSAAHVCAGVQATASAPATPAAGPHSRATSPEASLGPSSNPFFPAGGLPAASPTEPAVAAAVEAAGEPPTPPAPTWGASNVAAETGSLRSLRSPKARTVQIPADKLPADKPPAEPLANIKSAHLLLQKSLADTACLAAAAGSEACRDLEAIVQLVHRLMSALTQGAA